jgi:hypothetical protein
MKWAKHARTMHGKDENCMQKLGEPEGEGLIGSC